VEAGSSSAANRAHGPRGGALCDSMGLGKTVVVIALALARPRPPHLALRVMDTVGRCKLKPTGARATAWRLLIHAAASLTLSSRNPCSKRLDASL